MNDSVTFLSGLENKPTLTEAQQLVGGYVRLAELPLVKGVRTQMLFDEDGSMKDLPVNVDASHLFGSTIVGPVVILSGEACWVDY